MPAGPKCYFLLGVAVGPQKLSCFSVESLVVKMTRSGEVGEEGLEVIMGSSRAESKDARHPTIYEQSHAM